MCQQKEEKHMPTYSQGTFIPEMSTLMCVRTDCSNTGMLLRFQPELAYSYRERSKFRVVVVVVLVSEIQGGTAFMIRTPSFKQLWSLWNRSITLIDSTHTVS